MLACLCLSVCTPCCRNVLVMFVLFNSFSPTVNLRLAILYVAWLLYFLRLTIFFQSYASTFAFILHPVLSYFSLQNITEGSIWPTLAQESLKALGGLGLLSLGAKYILRRVFEVSVKYISRFLSKEIKFQTHFLYVLGSKLLVKFRLLQIQGAQRLLLLFAC